MMKINSPIFSNFRSFSYSPILLFSPIFSNADIFIHVFFVFFTNESRSRTESLFSHVFLTNIQIRDFGQSNHNRGNTNNFPTKAKGEVSFAKIVENYIFQSFILVSVLGREIRDLGRDRDSTEQAISAETETETKFSVDH